MCAHCGFDDDIIAAAAQHWAFPVETALNEIASRGYASREILADLGLYAKERRGYDGMAALFAKAQAVVAGNTNPAMTHLLAKLQVEYVEGQSRHRLAGVCGILTAEDVAAAGFDWYTDFKKFVKRGAALVFPMYARRNALSAFFCVNSSGVDEIFTLNDVDEIHYLGLRSIPAAGTEHAFLVTALRAAASLQADVAVHYIGSVPVVAAHIVDAENGEPKPLVGVGATALTVWDTSIVTAYKWAREQTNATIAMETQGRPNNPAAIGEFLVNVISTAQPMFKALALSLAAESRTEAALLYRQLQLTPAERNCLLAAAPIHVKPVITELVLGDTLVAKGSYDGREIRSSDQGWEYCDDSARISNFTLSLQETWSAEGRTMVRGVVVAGGRTLSFEADFNTVQNKTLQWLTDFLSKQMLPVPYMYDRALRKAVFDIAMSFGIPSARASGDAVRWEGSALVLPGFSIGADGVFKPRAEQETNTMASCSMYKPPAMLDRSCVFGKDEALTLWSILVHIAVNVTAPLHGYKSPGLIIAGAAREDWIRALSVELGLLMRTTSFVNGACTLEDLSVFPPIISVASEHSYRKWIADTRHNAILNSPRIGTRALRYLGWNFIDAKQPPSIAANAAIPQVLNLIRAAITDKEKFRVPGATPYYAMGQVASQLFDQTRSVEIAEAAALLGITYRFGRTPDYDSKRIVGSIYDLCRVGDLQIVNEPDGMVSVNWANYTAQMEINGIVAETRDRAISILRAAKAGRNTDTPAGFVKVTAESWHTAKEWSNAIP